MCTERRSFSCLYTAREWRTRYSHDLGHCSPCLALSPLLRQLSLLSPALLRTTAKPTAVVGFSSTAPCPSSRRTHSPVSPAPQLLRTPHSPISAGPLAPALLIRSMLEARVPLQCPVLHPLFLHQSCIHCGAETMGVLFTKGFT